MNVAIIPARGGSKRIPRKNIRKFAGKPIIAHSIEVALRSGLFERVIVSTDDEEISQVSIRYGAEAPFLRPIEIADDHTGTVEVIAHAVKWLQNEGVDLTAVCCLYATAPLIQLDDLRLGLTKLESGKWQYVFSATNFAAPIFRSFQKNRDGGIEMFFPENYETRSQDLPAALHDAGQFYWGVPAAWLAHLRFFDKWSTVVTVPKWRVQDIDSPEDWKEAEILYNAFRSRENGEH